MRLRARGPNGQVTLNLEESATVGDLKDAVSKATELPKLFDLRIGYPPQPYDLDQFADDVRLQDTGHQFHGEQLTVAAKPIAAPLAHPLQTPSNPPPPTAARPATPSTHPPTPRDAAKDPPEIPLSGRAGTCTLVLRVMPDDNSCLFRAFSAAALNGLATPPELRALVARTILDHPDKYNAAILDQPPAQYGAWITREASWGGAIELAILSEQFDVEVASVNVQDGRVDRFNEGKATRCILVYSGIHYDAIALSPGEPHSNTPAELDTTVFDAHDGAVLDGARQLCSALREQHYYVDTAGFTIRCNDCGWTGKGERAAVEHAQQTNHYNVEEVA